MEEHIHVSIYKTTFDINLSKRKLIEVCNPHNTIKLSSFQKFDENHLWLPYGLESKNLSTLPSDMAEEWQVKMILPKEVFNPDFEGTDEQIRRLNASLKKFNPEIRLTNYGLPISTIDGTKFIVDLQNNRLCEQWNPFNQLFFSEMVYKESGYMLNYDRSFKNINNDFRGPEIVIKNIPHKRMLDPKTMSIMYGYSIEEIKHKSDFELIVDQNLFRERGRGKVPTVDLAGNLYHFYIEKGLEPKNKKFPDIPIGKFKTRRTSANMTAYYNPKTGEILSPDSQAFKDQAPLLVFIQLPCAQGIDPFGMAKLLHYEVKDYLLKYPLQKHITAEATPIANIFNDLSLENNLPKENVPMKTVRKEDIQKKEKRTKPPRPGR